MDSIYVGYRITNDGVFQRAKEERLLLKIKKKVDVTHG